MTIGKPTFFDIEKYLDCVEGMILADEVERAFWMLGNPPSFYRANPTERMREIKESLHRAMFTAAEYAEADREADAQGSGNYFPQRGEIVAELVTELNKSGLRPNIMEVGCGTHWLFNGLKALSLDFSYEYRSLTSTLKHPQPGEPNIFIGFELIEHLQNEFELYQAYLKFNKKARYVLLSTPFHTFGGGMNQWRGQALGHLRAYSAEEFVTSAKKIFPDFHFPNVILCADGTQVVKGERV